MSPLGHDTDCLKRTQVPCQHVMKPLSLKLLFPLKQTAQIYSQLLDLQVQCKLCKWIRVVSTLQEHNSNCSGPQNNFSANINEHISEAEIDASFEKSSADHQSSSVPNSGIRSFQDNIQEASPKPVLTEKVLTKAIKIKLQASDDKMTLRFSTGGQPIFLVKYQRQEHHQAMQNHQEKELEVSPP